MKPRIYTYKVTFEEIPDWYWGSHKEIKYNDGYLGSPSTHAWKWEFYTPHLQICELFTYTDEGWEKAREVEDRCISPDLNNPLCLNEHVGGSMSLEGSRKGGREVCKLNRTLQRGIFEPGYFGSDSHKESCKVGGKIGGTVSRTPKDKCSLGGKKGGKVSGSNHKRLKRGLFSDEFLESEKYFESRVRGAQTLHSSLWSDPEHPELGKHHIHTLKKIQRQNGYPDGKENRVKHLEERVKPG